MSPVTQGCIVLCCCRWCSLSRRAARWSVLRTRPSRSTKPCPAAGRPRQPPGRASAASGATSTPSRASWSSSTSISTPRRTSPSCQHRNLQTKSLCENRKSSLVSHMSTSMQLNLFVVWSLEFSIVNSQVNSYIVVHIWQVSMKLFLVFRIIFCYFYTKCIILET